MELNLVTLTKVTLIVFVKLIMTVVHCNSNAVAKHSL